MKKNLYLIAVFVFLISCSEEEILFTDTDTTNELTERGLVKIESQYYDVSTGSLTNSGITLLEDGKVKTSLFYQNNTLSSKTIYEYNSNGLVSKILHFDGNDIHLTNQDYILLYDTQNRISDIVYSTYTLKFTYNNDNTVTRTMFNASSSAISTSTYSLNQDGKIYKYESGNYWLYDFEYENGNVISGTRVIGTSVIDVSYDYENVQDSKGYSYYKLYKSMYGSANNAIFTSNRSIENMISLYYGESNPTLVGYYSTQLTDDLVSTFHYIRDAENYVTEYDLNVNGDLYCNVKITYQD